MRSFYKFLQPDFYEPHGRQAEDLHIEGYGEFSIRVNGINVRNPTIRTEDGELDDIVTSTIDYDRLLEFADEELRHYLRMLTDIDEFHSEMITYPEVAPKGIRRGLSRRMLRHLPKLLQQGVVRETQSYRVISSVFTVPKKNGRLRLIIDARKVNRMMKHCPAMELPTTPEIIEYVCGARYFATVDAKSFFYAFGISEAVGELFSANLAGTKGKFHSVAMQRMPMGWNWAPNIAQKTANALLRFEDGVIGKAWIDNFVFVGKTEDEVREKVKRFVDRAQYIGLTLDTQDPEITQAGTLLGIEFDLQGTARYRLSKEWEHKAKQLSVTRFMSPRELYKICGNCVWSAYVRGKPMCQHGDAIEVIRNTAIEVQRGIHWDTPLKVTAREALAVGRWLEEERGNEWVQFMPPTKDKGYQVWSDASDEMWAFLHRNDGKHGSFDEETAKWHIYVKEAYAAHQGVQATRGQRRTLMVDNMPLVWAINKKLSGNKIVNAWLATWDWENIAGAVWVPTTEQLADRYTRGEKFE